LKGRGLANIIAAQAAEKEESVPLDWDKRRGELTEVG